MIVDAGRHPPIRIDSTLTVVGVVNRAAEVVSLLLDARAIDSAGWGPGAHVEIEVPGVGPRQYSLCGDPRDRSTLEIAVLRDRNGRGASELLHTTTVGSAIRVTELRNNFPLRHSPRCFFIAGGIGITPILPMVRQADQQAWDWHLLYVGRSRESMAFVTDLEQLGDRTVVHETSVNGRVPLKTAMAGLSPDTSLYCCGPEGLMNAVSTAAAALPTPLHVVLERFRPADVHESDDTSFIVELASSGHELEVPPGRSILDVILDAGVLVPNSCREGTCGTCEVAVLEGDVDHRDSILDDSERVLNEYMYPCVSRCRGKRLVIDI